MRRKRAINTDQELYLQQGGYDCNTPEIDEMVDLALQSQTEGAQISGAGLGGSIMVLVNNKNLDRVVEVLRKEYYVARGMKESSIVVSPVQGAGQL